MGGCRELAQPPLAKTPARSIRPSHPASRPEPPHPCGRCAPAHGRSDRHPRRASASRGSPSALHTGSSSLSSASASRVPCRNSIGIVTSERCAARSRDGRFAGCSGKPRNASPATPSSGSSACACEVIRPPNDLPPAISGRFGHCRRASATAARTAACATFGGSGRLPPLLHVGKLIAQRRDVALRKPVRDRRHERMRHAGARAMREHEAGGRLRRDLKQPGHTRRCVDSERDRLCDGCGISLLPFIVARIACESRLTPFCRLTHNAAPSTLQAVAVVPQEQ